MSFLQRISCAALTIAAMLLLRGTASARGPIGDPLMVWDSHSYSGTWAVTISRSQHSNGTGCLTLTQSGKNGGQASLVLGGSTFPFGTFQIFNHTLVTTIQVQGYGQNAGFVFIGAPHGGRIGPGVFDDVYGGEAFDEGALAFGARGSC
jgi:hypothetical protein